MASPETGQSYGAASPWQPWQGGCHGNEQTLTGVAHVVRGSPTLASCCGHCHCGKWAGGCLGRCSARVLSTDSDGPYGVVLSLVGQCIPPHMALQGEHRIACLSSRRPECASCWTGCQNTGVRMTTVVCERVAAQVHSWCNVPSMVDDAASMHAQAGVVRARVYPGLTDRSGQLPRVRSRTALRTKCELRFSESCRSV